MPHFGKTVKNTIKKRFKMALVMKHCVSNKRVHEREQRLQWFGNVERMEKKRAPVKAKKLSLKVQKKNRSKKRWKEVKKRAGLGVKKN